MQIPESTLKNMTRLLTREARLNLFQNLCTILGEPIPERVWRETGIRKTDVYRYLPKSRSLKGGLVPSPKTTVRVIEALLKDGGLKELQAVTNALDPVAEVMRKSYRGYFEWKKTLRINSIIFDPLSRKEIDKLEKSL